MTIGDIFQIAKDNIAVYGAFVCLHHTDIDSTDPYRWIWCY